MNMELITNESYLGNYEFIFSKKDYKSPWRYNSFVRQTNSPIPEQKNKINKMLMIKLDEFILDLIKNDLVKDELNAVVAFNVTKDKLEIDSIGYFNI
jgi:hypothetical protein